jgi:nucleotide-binding universal stress UspA family protein
LNRRWKNFSGRPLRFNPLAFMTLHLFNLSKTMKTILVPTDFSDHADNALYYAEALARQTNSRLILVHAIAREVIELPGNPFSLKPDPRLEAYYLDKLDHLAGRIRAKQGSHLKVTTQCVHGNILEHLHELVRSQEADLVVMGTKGAHHLVQKLMGTHTARYLKQAICPVLAVPLSARYQGLKKIAYAADFESADTIFLRQLFLLAQPLQAEVCIFNIKNEEQLDLVDDSQILRQIKRNFPASRYSICQLKEKGVVAGIAAFIRDNPVDMLALGIHHHDLLDRIFESSVSETLAFQATVPLLGLPENPYRPPQAGTTGRRRPAMSH